MLDVLTAAQQRLFAAEEPQDVAVATIVGTDGSVLRPVGTSMLVDAAGEIHGSLTGGCVEGAVLEACREALATGAATVQRFGYSDDDAFAVGLMCGGSIDVLVQPFSAGRSDLRQETDQQDPIAMVMRLPAADHDESSSALAVSEDALEERSGRAAGSLAAGLGTIVPPSVLDSAVRHAESMIRSGSTGTVRIAAHHAVRSPSRLHRPDLVSRRRGGPSLAAPFPHRSCRLGSGR